MNDEQKITINIHDDAGLACPHCGAYWGHPDESLNFPNRFKVDDWVKCYNPNCWVIHYNPFSGSMEYET